MSQDPGVTTWHDLWFLIDYIQPEVSIFKLKGFKAKKIWPVGGANVFLVHQSISYIHQQAQSRFLFWVPYLGTSELVLGFGCFVLLASKLCTSSKWYTNNIIALNGIFLLYNYPRSLTAMEDICSLAFNCFIITTIITNGGLPELRAKRGFYLLSSTCHCNKHSLEISPVLYFKVLHIQEPYLCILSGWLLLYKAVSISQDGMCRAGGWTNANVGSPTQLLMAHAWREAGTLQVPEQWCYLCYRCLCTFPAQRSFPPEHCLHPTSHPTRKVCASQWKGQGIFLFQQKYCMQKKKHKITCNTYFHS